MNQEFIKKMMMAEKYKYEAIKEILPINLRKKVEAFEKDALNLLKDAALEIINENLQEDSKENKKTTKKVDVDFS